MQANVLTMNTLYNIIKFIYFNWSFMQRAGYTHVHIVMNSIIHAAYNAMYTQGFH